MKILSFIFLFALVCLSCHREGNDAVPRRYAYPRLEAYDTVYQRVDVGPVCLDVNADAIIDSPKNGWLNISYPRYGATIFLSATRTDDIDEAVRNRRQRISLNLGGAQADTRVFSTGDFECMVVESIDAGTTPVQMLAVSRRGIVVSATANIDGPSTPADSIRPIVNALARDAVKMLTNLK